MPIPFRPRPSPARALRVLGWAAAAFLAGQVATGLLLDEAPLWVRFPQGAKAVWSAEGLGSTPYAALFGSSRFRNVDLDAVMAPLRAARGEAAPPVLQGAVLGGDPIVADELLRRILARAAGPRLAVVEISPETLSYPAHWIEDHATRFLGAGDLLRWAPEIAARGKLGEVLARRLEPVHVYRRELLRWWSGVEPPWLYVPTPEESGAAPPSRPGAVPAPTGLPSPPAPGPGPAEAPREASTAPAPGAAAAPPTPETESGLERMEEWLEGYRVGGGETRALERLVARCRAHGIRVVLVIVPVTSFQRALYTPAVEEPFRAWLDAFVRRTGVPVLDHRARVPDALFEDNHHLSPEGGRVYGAILAREAILPFWPDPGPGAGPDAPPASARPGA